MYKAKIILDSVAPCGKRLTTVEATYPRFVHSELMTHRMFSRNSASSRAIPVKKMLEQIRTDPAMPVWWGKSQTGMSADSQIEDVEGAKKAWLQARDSAVVQAENLLALGLHKQLVNRVLEPFAWITVIITATEWNNFFQLRRHRDAQPEIHKIADMIYDVREASTPVVREWHLPWIQEDEQGLDIELLKKLSTARNARVSYLTHDGKRDHSKDLELFEHLLTGSGTGHWSPFEHVARALDKAERSGNFVGWEQYRKTFMNECPA